MSEATVLELGRGALITGLAVCAPVLAAGLVVGVVVRCWKSGGGAVSITPCRTVSAPCAQATATATEAAASASVRIVRRALLIVRSRVSEAGRGRWLRLR